MKPPSKIQLEHEVHYHTQDYPVVSRKFNARNINARIST